MRILVVGGTRFIGRHLIDRLLAEGHEVTLFHRGRVGPELFPTAQHLVGDRDVDLSALATGRWDATVDTCAYVPRQVHQLADRLDGRGGTYTLVSSVSVYAGDVGPGYREDAPLARLDDPTTEEVTDLTYGGLKVLCERAAAERFGPALVVRPTYVVGPHDVSWRFPWWVLRLAAGGDVLAPGPPDAPVQLIDVRDLTDWLAPLVVAGHTGTFHTVGPATPLTWAELLDTVASVVAPPGTRLIWIDADRLKAEGVDDVALPLWPGVEPSLDMLRADPAAAIATGLSLRPLAATVADTLAWAAAAEPPSAAADRLSPTREADLLARLRP